MNRLYWAAALAITASLATLTSGAQAQALHGWCGSGATSACIDNGTNTPTMQNPPNPFGFDMGSGSATSGTLSLVVLVAVTSGGSLPSTTNTNTTALTSAGITGAMNSTVTGDTAVLNVNYSATRFTNSTLGNIWSGGDLGTFLGLSNYSPNNPIGAFLPAAQSIDGNTAIGFAVYNVQIGTETLAAPGTAPNQLFNISSPASLPIASYIVAFLTPKSATANSGAILVTDAGHPVPEPGSLVALAAGLGGLGMVRRRRRVA